MNLRGLGSAIALSALLVTGITPASVARTLSSESSVSGFIVQYEPGVSPIAQNGEATGANLLRGEVVSEDLGGGLFSLELENPIPLDQARTWLNRLLLDHRIAMAEANIEINKATLTPRSIGAPAIAKARPASAPKSLSARTAVTSSSPDRARVRLKWQPPANRFGASIVGYAIQYSSNGGATWRTLINNTGTNKTRAFVSDGIRAGINYRFRVRAITDYGSGSYILGTSSNSASVSVRTAPKPVYITSGVLVGPGNVNFLEQSMSDRGGFPASQVRYRAVASTEGSPSVETLLCNVKRCRFPSLIENTAYTVEVFVSNERGTTSSKDVILPSDQYFPVQWYMSSTHGVSMPAAWKYSRGDGNKVVAVIDTGIRPHQQIDSSLTRNPDGAIYGYDFVTDIESAGDGDTEDSNPNDEGGDSPGQNGYHGTQVAGIIVADHDILGTAGIAPNVKILPIRALGRDGGDLKDLLQAIRWATGEKLPRIPVNRFPVSVINLSLGAKDLAPCSGILASVIDAAISKGITVVAAAGNGGTPSLSFPANCKGVVSVAATQYLGDRATYSNYGEGTFISAPGGEFNVGLDGSSESRGAIITPWVDETNIPTYRLTEGTSMAAPVVSGIVALMYSMQPSIKPSQVRSILRDSVRPFPVGSTCAVTAACGAGIVNAQLALARTSAFK